MKKVISYFLFITLLFSTYVLNIEALDKYGKVSSDNGLGVNLRGGAGTTYDRAGWLDELSIVTIVDTVNTDDGSVGCPSGKWYKINYNDGYAYSCTDFIEEFTIETDDSFDATLLTFPESYRSYITYLHGIYPNATFVAYNTGIDWSYVVNNENALGKSLLWDSNGSRDGLKHLSSYDYETDTFYNNYPGGGSTWYAASDSTIAYYLDPRNFLDEKRVFMFESLSYNSLYHNKDGVESVLKNSFMSNAYIDGGNLYTFSDVILESGSKYGISPYYIGSRILQETGSSRSALVKGTYPSYPQYNGYYNFFNYGAGGTDVILNGLKYAYDNGWNSEYNAIYGGVSKIGTSYIGIGQDTNYFQKWDVICNIKPDSAPCYNHQYMQNIEAPYSEAGSTYSSYLESLGDSMYTSSYVFTIPLYDNMPSVTNLVYEKNPNNYLSSLKVNGVSVSNFSGFETSYNFTVPSNTTSVNVTATALTADKGAKVSGVGNINITSNEQVIPIIVTAENGSKKTYNITVSKTKSANNNLSNIKINGSIIEGFTSSKQSYSMSVDYNVTSVSLSATLEDSKAKILTDLSDPIQLNYGVNNVSIEVAAENGSKKIYTLSILKYEEGESPYSSNNNLKDIKLNGSTISGFDKLNQNYNIIVKDSVSSVLISGVVEDSKAKVVTDLSKSFGLKYGMNNVLIEVEAENKSKKTYTLNIERSKGINYTIENIKSGTINNNYFSGLTNVDTLNNAFKNSNENASVTIKDLSGNVVTTGSIGTGYKVNITVDGETKELETIIYGDNNGDGNTTILDLLRVQKQLLGSLNLSGSSLKASDVSKDGKVDILDLLKVKKHLLGSSQISQ